MLFLIFFYSSFATIGSNAALSVSVGAPVYATVGTSVSVSVNTFYATEYINIFKDNSLIKSCYGVNYCTASFQTDSYITKHSIKGTAFGCNSRTKDIRLIFPIPSGNDNVFGIPYSTWYTDASDYARSPGNTLVWDVSYRILQYYHSGNIYWPSNAIAAFVSFSDLYFDNQYQSQSNALTAYESASLLNNVNFEGGVAVNRKFHCADMAAFLSGAALSLGIPSRMVSLSNLMNGKLLIERGFNHIFAELYGIGAFGNNGWYLIDPGTGNVGTTFTSDSDYNSIKAMYSSSDGEVSRFSIISGMTSSQWGQYVSPPATYWIYSTGTPDPTPPNKLNYTPNPWGITISEGK